MSSDRGPWHRQRNLVGGESKYWAASCWYLTVWLCEVLFQKQEYNNVCHIAYAYTSQFPWDTVWPFFRTWDLWSGVGCSTFSAISARSSLCCHCCVHRPFCMLLTAQYCTSLESWLGGHLPFRILPSLLSIALASLTQTLVLFHVIPIILFCPRWSQIRSVNVCVEVDVSLIKFHSQQHQMRC